jgi:hypothetical protein
MEQAPITCRRVSCLLRITGASESSLLPKTRETKRHQPRADHSAGEGIGTSMPSWRAGTLGYATTTVGTTRLITFGPPGATRPARQGLDELLMALSRAAVAATRRRVCKRGVRVSPVTRRDQVACIADALSATRNILEERSRELEQWIKEHAQVREVPEPPTGWGSWHEGRRQAQPTWGARCSRGRICCDASTGGSLWTQRVRSST